MLAVAVAVMTALSAVLVIGYVIPSAKVLRTETDWFGSSLLTVSEPPVAAAHYYISSELFCTPSSAVGNLTVSLTWQSSDANTTARLLWIGGGPPIENHVIYWVNNTTAGGYSFPQSISNFLCESFNEVSCVWITPGPGAVISVTGVRAYNYTATQPIW